MNFILLILTIGLTVDHITSVPIDNGVVGYPHVTCGPHSIKVSIDTERTFGGRVFVKGESDVAGCNSGIKAGYGGGAPPDHGDGYNPAPRQDSYAPQPAPQGYGSSPVGSTVMFELALGQCNMRRQRTLYPRGVEYTYTLVISFHQLFITKVDRAYRVRCFYMEAEKTVNQQIDVSMLTTAAVNEQFPMPQCRYHIKRDSYDGPYVRYAKVGDKVFHVWECDHVAAYVYGILVKSCYVDDGKGNKVQLVNEKGCATDKHLVPQLSYDQKLIKAYVETHVFKYADNPQLYFTCTIELCFKGDGGCTGITPPNCGYDSGHQAGPYVDPHNQAGYVPPPTPAPYVAPQPQQPYGNQNPQSYEGPVQSPYDQGPYDISPYTSPPNIYESSNQGPSYGGLPSPIPFPNNGPRYGAPYNRDSPIEVNGDKIDKLLPSAATGDDVTSDDATNGSKPEPLIPRLKRKVDEQLPKRLALIEADISAQPVLVLPFEEDEDMTKENDDDLLTLSTNGNAIRKTHFVQLTRGSNQGGLPGVCLSSTGFGMMLSLFVGLFMLAAICTAILLRLHLKSKMDYPKA